MILHIISAEKFTSPFIDFIEENIDDFVDNHQFWIGGDTEKFPVRSASNISLEDNYGYYTKWICLLRKMYKAERIILHGLFRFRLVQLLAMQPWLLKKCYWIMWGGDLYYYMLGRGDLVWHKNELFRRFVIKRMGHLVTYIEGDIELARQWYGARGKYHECFMYPSNLYKEYSTKPKTDNIINILIGNSADPSNNHLEILKLLEPYRNDGIRIYAPLSYGSPEYAQEVSEVGKLRFGENFTALMNFMVFEEYLELLGKIDIAVFNHNRQQAMGNTITLLGLGKKVYMRNNVTTYRLFSELEIKIFDIKNFNLTLLSAKDAASNCEKIKAYFSKKQLACQLIEIFGS